MNMSKLMDMIEERRGDVPIEDFVRKIGIRSGTYFRQKDKSRSMGIKTLKNYAKYFQEQGDTEMLKALAAYALGIKTDQVEININ